MDTYTPDADAGPVVFCMDLPRQLPRNPRTPHTWIPMADWFLDAPIDAWNTLPSYLQVVAFSKEIEMRAHTAGLAYIALTYYYPPPPAARCAADRPRTMMYWNRRGILNRDTLSALCEIVDADRLFFRPSTDPGTSPALRYRLGRRLGKTKIVHLPANMDRVDYLGCLRDSVVFVASRAGEGVGLTFLEALAYGCAVVALDRPTMNEYVCHGKNGALLPFSLDRYRNFYEKQGRVNVRARASRSLRRLLPGSWMTPAAPSISLISKKDLISAGLGDANWETMACQAAEMSRRGHARWLDSLDKYSRFISGEDVGS